MLIRLPHKLFLLLFLFLSPITAKQDSDPYKKFENVRVDEKNFAKIRNMHVNWYATSIKALMGQLGKELFAKLDSDEQQLLSRCLDKIDDKKDLVLSARCLVLARKRYKKRSNQKPDVVVSKDNKWLGGFRVRDENEQPILSASNTTKNSTLENAPKTISTINSTKINVIPSNLKSRIRPSNNNYRQYIKHFPYTNKWTQNLKAQKSSIDSSKTKLFQKFSPVYSTQQNKELQQKHKFLNSLIEIRQIPTDHKNNINTFKLLKSTAQRLQFKRAKRLKRNVSWFGQTSKYQNGKFDNKEMDSEPWQIKKADNATLTSPNDQSPVSRITNLISMFVKTPTQDQKTIRTARERQRRWSHTYNKLLEMKKTIDEKEKSPAARAYNLRMYDIVLGNERPTESKDRSRTPKGLVDMAMDLFSRMGGDQGRTERRRTNSKFLSPRFAPLMPDKIETDQSELSPTILAFYDEPGNKTSSNNIASIPQILKATGMEKRDSDAVMGMIMDVSGARDTVEDALGMLNNLNFFGIENEIMGATEVFSAVYDKLEKSMSKKQSKELDSRGFTFMDMNQINKLYRDSALNVPEEAMNFDAYAQLKPSQREESLWKTIEKIAINNPEEPLNKNSTEHRRFKRTGSLTVPSVLAPTILAPFIFTPIFGLSVLGPTILSPSLFSPLILNPAVLSPYILSPSVGLPFILSPYLLSPYILSPLVFAPFILNPYVLSPNVLNPYLLSPLILSPLVLCPDVISPMALGGAILSPSVASPAVFTETVLMANVLSPSFLS